MKVFICWSEERSRIVAECLHDWLKRVIQQLKPFLPTKDIRGGKRWNSEIANQLSETKFGILCLTRENLDSKWINFEAGALSKTIDDKTFVCPYYIGDLEPAEVSEPLGQFQGFSASEEGTLRLLKSINSALADGRLDEDVLGDGFKKYWPDLREILEHLPQVEGEEKPKRNTDDMIKEILTTVQGLAFMIQRHEEPKSPSIAQFLESCKPSSFPDAKNVVFAAVLGDYLKGESQGRKESTFEKLLSLAARDVVGEERKKMEEKSKEELKNKEELKKEG